jgi:hypothetical protein
MNAKPSRNASLNEGRIAMKSFLREFPLTSSLALDTLPRTARKAGFS